MKKTLAFALFAQAISIGILLVLALQFFKQLKAFQNYSAQVEHTYLVINQLGVVQSLLNDAEASSRGYVITRSPSFLTPLQAIKTDMLPAVDSLRNLIGNNVTEKKILGNIERLAYEKMVMQLENAQYVKRYSNDSMLLRMERGKEVMEAFKDNIDDLKASELLLLDERKQSKQFYEDALPENVRVVFTIAGLSTLIFGFWIFFELKKRFLFQGMLQQKLVELRQNNEELEQIAFAASHDLQEPLRKIRIFSDRLLGKLKEKGDEDNVQMAHRMNTSATRLQGMITDLVELNNLVHNTELVTAVSLEKIVADAEVSQGLVSNGLLVQVSKDSLPTVHASTDQLHILINQLFTNALQFKSEERKLVINIGCHKINGKDVKGLPEELRAPHYYHVTFADNGIGFDEAFKDKMFKPFQRLHNYDAEKEMRHKGMGLAMCRRVMLNLGGWIDASGKVGEGATIHLYFPVG